MVILNYVFPEDVKKLIYFNFIIRSFLSVIIKFNNKNDGRLF